MEAGFLGSGVGASGVRKDERRKTVNRKKNGKDRVKERKWVEDKLEAGNHMEKFKRGERKLSAKNKEKVKARELALG